MQINTKLIVVYLNNNVGNGKARNIGVLNSSSKYIAIMDSDDISIFDRFEKQYKQFQLDPNLSVCGGQIVEFSNNEDNITGQRIVPESDDDIKRILRSKSPVNHVTAMLKRDDVIKSGNYDCSRHAEDYYLWARMAVAQCKFKNLNDILVKVRVGNEMCSRRGGWNIFLDDRKVQRYLFDRKKINLYQYLFNVLKRLIVDVLITNKVRSILYKISRKKILSQVPTHKVNKGIIGPFGVFMSVYRGDRAENFKKAFDSIFYQTLVPREIVLVVDGPVNEDVKIIINNYIKQFNGEIRINRS